MDPITLTIAAVAMNVGVPAELLQAVCWVETKHRNVVTIRDGKDSSLGACQVKPQTARYLARKLGRRFYSSDLLNVEKNATYAALYLKHQLNRYKGDVWLAVDAYNKGTAKKRRSQPDARKARLQIDRCYRYRSTCNQQAGIAAINQNVATKQDADTRYVTAVKDALRSKPWMVEIHANNVATLHSVSRKNQ